MKKNSILFSSEQKRYMIEKTWNPSEIAKKGKTEENWGKLFLTYKEFDPNPSQKMAKNEKFILLKQAEN